jgi:thermitase
LHWCDKLIGVLVLIMLFGLGLRQEHGMAQPTDELAFAPDRILVKKDEGAPAGAIESINRQNDARVEDKLPHSRASVIDLPQDLSVREAVRRYESSPNVEYAEPDYKIQPALSAPTPSDPLFPRMYDLYNRGQSGGTFDADIDGLEAWKATTGSADTVVAVIDTGMDINHKDLRDNVWTNPDEIPGNRIDDDHNNYVDDVHGWDFFNDDASVYDGANQDTHATHVAGTIAAEGNNGVGVTGVNWRARVMPLKFIGPGNTGYVSGAAAALDYAVAEGVKISNNSYGFYNFQCGQFDAQTLRDAIGRADRKGHLVVAAAMNGGTGYVGDNIDGADLADPADDCPVYPASYENPNIIAVAASNNQDKLTSFSNYGKKSVDLAAPGKRIWSTFPDDKYGYGEGTSMATPHVTGAAALIKSQQPQWSDEQIKARILRSVDKIPSLGSKLVSGGRLNAAKALGANTAPVILGVQPSSAIRDRTPIISATVRDDETELAETQIELYIDGRLKQGFGYDAPTDGLTYQPGRLSTSRHTVKVVADDGRGLVEARTWSFTIKSRH